MKPRGNYNNFKLKGKDNRSCRG